jgi:DNA repair exonuclease SbcCD ATPase subunit
MIKELSLSYFRKVIDETMVFSEGLNLLRGPNESSKSTRIEAILFALYGSRVLRDSLAQCVTWGSPVSKLRVTLTVDFNGVTYSFKRGSSGAEVIKDGVVFVTGQAEVTAFSATLLGADAKTAGSLMLADQSGLRGALDEGPAAVSGLMSKLADFDTIDRIILAMQETLLLGADAPIREKLKTAEAERDEAFAAMPAPSAVADAELAVSKAETKANALRKQRDENEAPAYNLAIEKMREAEAAQEKYMTAMEAAGKSLGNMTQAEARLENAKSRVIVIDHDRIASLRKDVFDIAEAMKRASAWEAFKKLPALPDVHWEGDSDSFHTHLQNSRSLLDTANAKVSHLNAQINAARSRKIEGGLCKVCGTDVSKRPDILETNAAVDREVAALNEQLNEWKPKAAELANEIQQLDAIARAARNASIPASVKSYVTEENLTVPTRYLWVGGDGYVNPDFDKLKDELASLERAAEASNRAEGEVKALERALAQARLDHAAAEARLQTTPATDLAPYNAAHRAAADALNLIDNKVYDADKIVEQARADHEALLAQQQSCMTRLNLAKLRIDEYTKDIEAVGFNNSLLKKMRAIKPLVTDHLWGSVLAAVSQFFTQLRGEASVVTKDSDGFKVNGASVKSLSGSTLDVLALAVRVALTKTFIPNSSMLILDECAAACDKDRTSNLLGFLAATHFRQIILASHDELSLSVADNVLDLSN